MIIGFLTTLIILGILSLAVYNSVDIASLQKAVVEFPKIGIILVAIASLIISTMKSYRFFWLLKYSDINIDFFQAAKAYTAGAATSPLPAGELLRASLLKKETGERTHITSGPVIAQAYLELLSAIFLTIIGSFIFEVFRVPAFSFLVIGLGIFLLLIYERPLVFLIKKTANIKPVYKFINNMKRTQGFLKKTFVIKNKLWPNLFFIRAFIISLGIHILSGFLVFFIAWFSSAQLNIAQSIYVYSLGFVASSIGSFSPGGLGFTEGSIMAALLFFGVALPQALIIVVIFRLVTLIFNIFLGLIFLLAFYRKVVFKF